MLLLDALYINNSGGKVLLDYLIQSLVDSQKEVFFLLDERVKGSYDFLPQNKVLYLEAGMKNRYSFYNRTRTHYDQILCFGNVPPLMPIDADVTTYFHQVLYLSPPKHISRKKKLTLRLKANFIKYLRQNTNRWAVQSPIVKEALATFLSIKEDHIKIIPFFKLDGSLSTSARKKDTYLFVSDGNSHKNHIRLIEAFEAFNRQYPSTELHLTISARYPAVLQLIDEKKKKGINIVNHGFVPKTVLNRLYASVEYLVYPSLSESFGLGIIEGISAGCKVIGADLPYMHTVCQPSITLNPLDVKSIERALVKTQHSRIRASHLLVENKITELIDLFDS